MDKDEKRILYIDDEQQNLDGFKFVFYREFDVHLTTDTDEVLQIIEEQKIKVVISDQKMPKMTGLELISVIKEKFPDIVCIILTAFTEAEALIEAVNMGGIFRYVLKPWDENDLKFTINNALDRYHYLLENKRLLEDVQQKNKLLENYNHDLKEMVEELKAAKEKAEESDRLKQSFLQNISHEIRTPMNGILGFAELLSMPNLDETSRLNFIETINKSGTQLLNIIDNVLDVAKIEAGEVEIVKSDFNLNELLEDVYNFHAPLIDQNVNLILENTFSDKNAFVNTDRVKLRQILDNLLQNARKFTSSGKIILGIKENDRGIECYVSDTGKGIPKEFINVIFEPFRQVSPTINKNHTGTGLGLSITQSYARLLGGDLWVESIDQQGSIFHVNLPFNIQFNDEPNNKPLPESDMVFKENKLVLIVEDDDVNFEYLDNILKSMNLETIRAINGNQAITIGVNTNEICLILMDIKLPDFSGLIAAHSIKEKRSDIPIVAQTSYAINNIRDMALTSGCDAFITKPLFKKDLFPVLKNFLSVTSQPPL